MHQSPDAPADTEAVGQRTVAVVGASSVVGRAILGRLAASDLRVVGIDVTVPDMPPGNVEMKLMDARDRLLPLAVEGAEVLVYAAAHEDIAATPDTLYGVNVGGMRNVLAAATAAAVAHVVVVSSGTVYGAHHDNPVPLDEDAPLRANPGFAYGYQRRLAEGLATDWAGENPQSRLTILRPAPILGPGVDHALARLLGGPRLAIPAGGRPLWQFTHVADLAEAVATVVDDTVDGTFNVGGDGWLTTQEVARALGTRIQWVGQSTYREVLRQMALLRLSPAPPEALDYVMHPWVLDVSRLRSHGWRPTHSNAETLAQFSESVAGQVALGTLTFSRSGLRNTGMGLVGLFGLAAWRLIRR